MKVNSEGNNDNESSSDKKTKDNSLIEEDDWQLPLDFNLIAQHEKETIVLPDGSTFFVQCVESLTPLDMMNLGSGNHDATRHCVWTGAFVLIAALEIVQDLTARPLHILELGCGTGIGGIAMLAAKQPAAHVCFTDSDPEALSLCRRNCELNQLSDYSIEQVTWGEGLPTSIQPRKFNVVLATDVLYDIGLLKPLFTTAKDCLETQSVSTTAEVTAGQIDRHFVLSHVPRACFNSKHPPPGHCTLQEYIIQQAKLYGFHLESTIRPSDLKDFVAPPVHAFNHSVCLEELEQIGAAIFVFRL